MSRQLTWQELREIRHLWETSRHPREIANDYFDSLLAECERLKRAIDTLAILQRSVVGVVEECGDSFTDLSLSEECRVAELSRKLIDDLGLSRAASSESEAT